VVLQVKFYHEANMFFGKNSIFPIYNTNPEKSKPQPAKQTQAMLAASFGSNATSSFLSAASAQAGSASVSVSQSHLAS